MYIDDYGPCEKTYATLCIYPGNIDPNDVTLRLGIEPTSWQRKGEVPVGRKIRTPAKNNGWFLESESHVQSRDSRRHIDWILDALNGKEAALAELQVSGCRTKISCYWLSKNGHGGPTLSPYQMKRLSALDMELWFDIYGPYEGDEETDAQQGIPADTAR